MDNNDDDKRLDRIEQGLDKCIDQLGEIKITLVRNTDSLEVHVKRTNLLEEQLKPLEKHVSMVQGAVKFIGILAMLAAIYMAAKAL